MSLKIIFFIFAALAGLALIGSLSPEGKKQTTTAATEIENRAFTAPTAFLNATPYGNVLGRKGKYASPTTPKRSTNPAHEENAKAIADGQRDGKAFATTLVLSCLSSLYLLKIMV
jgi:hypothetical protein